MLDINILYDIADHMTSQASPNVMELERRRLVSADAPNISGNEVGMSNIGDVLANLLDNEQYSAATEEIQKTEHASLVSQTSMELIPELSRRLHGPEVGPELRECVEQLLLHIAEVGSVKEVIITLLEELNLTQSEEDLPVVLNPLRKCLVRHAGKNCSVALFRWVI